MASECLHTGKFCRSLEAQGCLVHVNHANRFTGKGFPDRTLVAPWGCILLLELKAESGTLRPDQIQWFDWLKEKNAMAFVGRFEDAKPYKIRLEDHVVGPLTCYLMWRDFLAAVRQIEGMKRV